MCPKQLQTVGQTGQSYEVVTRRHGDGTWYSRDSSHGYAKTSSHVGLQRVMSQGVPHTNVISKHPILPLTNYLQRWYT